jgi:hypothetical protein
MQTKSISNATAGKATRFVRLGPGSDSKALLQSRSHAHAVGETCELKER